MKTSKPFHLSHIQIMELLMNLSINDCRRAASLLSYRIEKHEHEKLICKAKRQRPENFLDTLLADYDLSTRTKNLFAANGITTVRHITEIGFDTLLLLRHFGKATVREIREVIFENELHAP